MGNCLCQAIKIADLDIAARGRLDSLGIDFSDLTDCYILPGFTDVHVHLREPGFLYKETMKTGTAAAAAGGFTEIFAMPNLKPCPDSSSNLNVQLRAIEAKAMINVSPYGAITVGQEGQQLADMKGIAHKVVAFSDDGRGVANEAVMLKAMKTAKSLGKIIVAHCEEESYPRESSESEWKQLKRDIELVKKTGCSYHMCHVSTKESIALIRKAKVRGLDITCETAPHYLCIDNSEIEDDGRFKMNPPIKSPEDKKALIEALQDGTIDMIATDHAPHSEEEKSGGFKDSAYGIVGLETAFPVLYTKLVLTGIINMERLIELLYVNPRNRFGLQVCGLKESLATGKGSFSIWNLDEEYQVKPEEFFSKGRSTPFEGWRVKGRCMATVAEGRIVWRRLR